ncbi:MAG: hypothetical protein NTY37_06430 [Methanothrix sp.]|nr:hypothetical protein [Methanothrix sp.]
MRAVVHDRNMGKLIKQLRAESPKLSAALVVVADLEGAGGVAAIRARLRERREAARAAPRYPPSGIDRRPLWVEDHSPTSAPRP